MSFLKAALAVAAVAGVGYVAVKLCKNKNVQKVAGAVLTGMAHSQSTPVYREPVKPVTVVITETETTVVADKSKLEGVMGVAAHVKAQPVKVHVRATARTTEIEVERTTAGLLKPLSDRQAEKEFSFDGLTIPR